MIREFRVALAGYEYEFPAGLIDPGESIEEAARRELWEETGLEITQVTKVSPPVYSSAGMTDESVSIVYAQCEGLPDTKYNADSELIEVMFVKDIKEIQSIINDASLRIGAKAWIVLDGFVQRGTFHHLNANSPTDIYK